MSISLVKNVLEKLVFCRDCYVSICNGNGDEDSHCHHNNRNNHYPNNDNDDRDDGEDEIKVERTHRRNNSESSAKSNSSMVTLLDQESCFSFERPYVLNTYPLTSDFYDVDDIGKFLTDIDGFCLYINDKGAEHIGESRKKIKFSLMWSYNLFSDDIINAIHEWQECLDHEKVLIYKERRIVQNKFVHLIIEAYPIISRKRFKGMKGIIMRVTKPVWHKFDVKVAKKILIEMELKLEECMHIPIHIKIAHMT
jgi:hypothetical protein